jgi:hypothetical protein
MSVSSNAEIKYVFEIGVHSIAELKKLGPVLAYHTIHSIGGVCVAKSNRCS